jgi:hypothetical protein
MAVTIGPTVVSSFRAGMTTLTVVRPLACSSRSSGQSCALLVRYASHASATGDIPVGRMLILPPATPRVAVIGERDFLYQADKTRILRVRRLVW